MARNLNRLTAAANRQAAHHDFMFVWSQVKQHNPPQDIYSFIFSEDWNHTSAKTIARATRGLITWAQTNGVKIDLPEDWT